MPFLIPNAGDTTGGNAFAALDQAEPDSLDFEILGNPSSGVFSGCAVTPSAATTVSVAAGVVVLRGVPYTVAAASSFSITAGPADARFDLIVARINTTTGVATLQLLSGGSSSSNPTYPKSKSVATAGTVDLNTDVVLAAIYRPGNTTPTAQHILDKRVRISSAISYQSTGSPSASAGDGPGSLYYQTGVPVGSTLSSGVWVKTGPGTAPWIELSQNIPASSPLGAMVVWPSGSVNPPAGWLPCDGRPLATSSFNALWAIIGYTYGGSGATFNIPDMHHKFIRGTTTAAEVNNTLIGADSVNAPLPVHSHDLGSHVHSFSHAHSFDHGHTGTADVTGSHQHGYSNNPTPSTNAGVVIANSSPPASYNLIGGAPGPGQVLNLYATSTAGMLDAAGAHGHNVTIGATSGLSTGGAVGTFGAAVGNTGSAGAAGNITTIPTSLHARWIIRVSVGGP
jgi:microcystin-dependent protein